MVGCLLIPGVLYCATSGLLFQDRPQHGKNVLHPLGQHGVDVGAATRSYRARRIWHVDHVIDWLRFSKFMYVYECFECAAASPNHLFAAIYDCAVLSAVSLIDGDRSCALRDTMNRLSEISLGV